MISTEFFRFSRFFHFLWF